MKPLILFSVVLLLSTIFKGAEAEILAEESKSNKYSACDHYCNQPDNNLVSRCCKVAGFSFGVCGNDKTAICESEKPAPGKECNSQCTELKKAIHDFSTRITNTCKG